MPGRSLRLALSLFLLAALAAPSACKPDRPRGRIAEVAPVVAKSEKFRDWVVGRIGDREITYGEMQDVLESLPVFARMRYQTPERRRDFLETYVQYVVLGLAAQSEGYGKDPIVLERLKQDLVDRFLQEHVSLKVKTTDIADAQVREYYAGHPHEFKAPARVRLAHLRLQDAVLAEKLAFRIRKTLEAATGDPREVFTQYVQRYSDDAATKAHGGDLGLFPRLDDPPPGVPDVVVEAGLKLTEPFQVSPMVPAADGFHVVLRAGVTDPIDETLEQARPRIVEHLMDVERDRLRAALLADLSKRAGVKVNEDVAARVAAEVEAESAKARAAKPEAASPAMGGTP